MSGAGVAVETRLIDSTVILDCDTDTDTDSDRIADKKHGEEAAPSRAARWRRGVEQKFYGSEGTSESPVPTAPRSGNGGCPHILSSVRQIEGQKDRLPLTLNLEQHGAPVLQVAGK
jgi:hypothetical protein